MRIGRRIGGFAMLLTGALLAQAPAWLVDTQLDKLTDGALRLAGCEGSIWSGGGTLTVIDPIKQQAQPWVGLNWDWRPWRLLQGEMAWRLRANGAPAGEIAVGLGGWRADELALNAPARFAMERIPHAFGRFGWHGEMALSTQRWRCDWHGRCDGDAQLRWIGVAADIFLGRPIGDYQIALQAQKGNIDLLWTTLGGETHVDAHGALRTDAHWNLSGTVRGNPEFLSRLPAIANKWVRATGATGEYAFDVGG